ncbi:MAG: TIM44-like domain-containing protein [Rhodospirillales bacterium]|nr:TIM44-like domain-containing protein [Rhodospirillales bacterium]MDE2200309.1 TIM44-like domain-containing protein [Rhodospirillales bacterium]
MRRMPLLALLLAAVLALAPGFALARAGSGSSFGSRGSYTYSRPPATSTAPYSAAPMQRSLTPQSAPSYGGGMGYGGRSSFTSGLMGGLLGAGLAGMLFGGGMFGGMHGFGGFFGFLLQIFLIVMLVRWLWRRFVGQPVLAGGGTMFAPPAPAPGAMPMGGGGPAGLAIQPADYQAFEQLLQAVQAAWSASDIAAMQRLATPEMVSYFAEQLSDFASRDQRNTVSDVRLLQGDLAQAWHEGGRDYATVAMRFSMIDTTRDASGRVVDGDPAEHVTATELWTFLRAGVPGGHWILSAIQQAA